MKTSVQTELPLIGIVLIPFIYLAYVWDKLPEKVPMHWNIEGQVDRYGDKSELILIPLLLPLLIYVLFTVIPKIDPKDKLKHMGKKYTVLKTVLTAFMSALSMMIIYAATNGYMDDVELKDVGKFEKGLYDYVSKTSEKNVIKPIVESGQLDDKTEAALKKAVEGYKRTITK